MTSIAGVGTLDCMVVGFSDDHVCFAMAVFLTHVVLHCNWTNALCAIDKEGRNTRTTAYSLHKSLVLAANIHEIVFVTVTWNADQA